MDIKLFLVVVLVLLGVGTWLLPKTPFGIRFTMNEKVFSAMNTVGIVCGVAGLILTLVRPDLVLQHHYFELILLPVLILYLYSAVIMKVKRKEIYDEKQTSDMTRSAAVSFVLSIVAMFLLYALYRENVIEGLVWFPFFVYFTLTVYSAGTLLQFRKQ